MTKKFDKYSFWIFLFISIVFFYPTYKYGYVTDFLSWLIKYEEGSWSDLKDCFDYPGLHHFFHLINFSVFKIVGKSFFGWYLVMSLMQGVNGYLCYTWTKKLNLTFGLSLPKSFSWFVALMFMLSPYALEPVVWKACLHYLLCMGLILGGLIYLTDYLREGKTIWRVHLCFVLALFTLEISLAVPFIYMMYWITFAVAQGQLKKIGSLFVSVTLPQLLLIVGYFLANKWILGAWVGHYGADKHLSFDFHVMSGHAFQYLGKYLFFLHYLPFKTKIPIYDAIYHPYTIGLLIFISIVGLGLLYFYGQKWKRTAMPIAFAYVSFFMGLFPISNLFFFKNQIYENDRYGFLGSLFIYLFIGLLLWSLPKIWRNIAAVVFASCLLYCSTKTVHMAYKSGEMTHALVDDFDFYDEKNIVVLSKPDNLGGLQLFRDLSGKAQSFTESLWHFRGMKYEGTITDLAQINIFELTDRVGVDVIDSSTLKVKNPQNGSWFWRNGFGLGDYETEDFIIDKEGWYYMLHIKDPSVDRIFIYSDGMKWKTIDFSNPIGKK